LQYDKENVKPQILSEASEIHQ